MSKTGKCYDIDYTEVDEANELKTQQEEQEETETETNESVPNECMFLKQTKSNIQVEKKPTKKQPKLPKDGNFDICGFHGVEQKHCDCFYCSGYIKCPSLDSDWYATKLDVHISRRHYAKLKGARWSKILNTWYVRANNPHYKELCDIY